MRTVLLSTLLLVAVTAPVRGQELVSGVSQDLIQITSNYTGSDIVVFGAVEGQTQNQAPGAARKPKDVVVVVRGPDADITVRRRDRVAGIWINHDAADLSGMPSYYFLASTRPLSAIAPADVLARYGIGIQSLKPDAVHSHHDYEPFRQAALRHLEQSKLYSQVPGGVEFLSATLFRAHVPVPAGVTRGQYNVEVFLFRDKAVISAQSTPLFIDQTGLERRLYNFAHNQSFDYGLATVLMAIVMGWMSSLLFRRPV
ncbi:MAG TPA: TIGR02186 family protein [Rhizomicrobium sp.]|nr:TIGR02186 family protein [Rhizomicrobium sp.]